MDEPETVEFDVAIIGSGAAGLTAALRLAHDGVRVVVLEKSAHFGGSSARSGGALWVPGNDVLRAAGVADTPEQAGTYLAEVAGPDSTPARQQALLDHGPAMVSFVCAQTPLAFGWVPGYSDYYPEWPGGKPGGRTIEPRPLDGRVLGPELAHLAAPYQGAPGGVVVTATDYRWLSLGLRNRRSWQTLFRLAGRTAGARLRGRRLLGMGQALAAGLRAGLLRYDVPLWLDTPMTGLSVTDGRVDGVWVTRAGRRTLVRARHGVLLASGGFERNEAMRQQYQRAPIGTEWTVGAAGNTGDGITAGQDLGAAVDLMDDAWWGPSIPLPGGPWFCLAERSLPGGIIVNGLGRRFMNEALPYVDAVHAMYDNDRPEAPHIPAWLVFDQRYRDRYLFAGKFPGQKLPGRWYKSGSLHRASTLDGLATALGIEPAALAATVARFNTFAESGVDEDFHRGDSAYDRYYGDPHHRPNPNLAALVKPPFYAAKLVPGDLGTKGGLRTDERARVLRPDGTAIPGLYAAGNATAAVMGHSYAGAGATIGPAMTFAYIAAHELATVPVH